MKRYPHKMKITRRFLYCDKIIDDIGIVYHYFRRFVGTNKVVERIEI